MAEQLRTLHRLQSLDLTLRAKQAEIDRFDKRLTERREQMAACRARIDELSALRKQLVSDRALAERRVADQEDMLRDKRQRIQRARTERELRAGEDEVSILSNDKSEAETEALELMSKVEEIEATIASAKGEYSELEEADHRHVDQEAANIEQLKSDLEAERRARNEVAAALDPVMRKRYDRVLAARSGLAVVEVKGGFCEGCHMHVPAQLVIEILKTGSVKVCPHCQRILYVAADEVSESEISIE